MVLRRIPRHVLAKLRFYGMTIRQLFPQFKNIDHRGIEEKNPHEKFPRGTRVREIDLSKTSIVPVALKWVHDASARKTLKVIFSKVKVHNTRFGSKDYVLLMPKAYVIDEHIVAMSKEEHPTLEEVLERSTHRGKVFFARLAQKNGTTIERLTTAARLVEQRTGIRPDNMLIWGIRKGKFVFVPLIDLF